MANGKSRVFFAGGGMVWRRQRVLWWIFIVNLFLSWHAIGGITSRTHDLLDHSLAASALVHRFDFSLLAEMSTQPGFPALQSTPSTEGYSAVFFFFMLLVTGGILEVYRRDATLTTAEFFEAGAACFWRFLRLVIYFAICLVPAGIFFAIVVRAANRIEATAVSPMSSIWVEIAGSAIVLIYVLVVRLWFDMAEIHAVAQDEKKMHRALRAAARITFGNFWRLFWLYARIGIVGWIGFCFGLWLWMYKLRPDAITSALILSQAMILWWIGTRLWQRASETLWYGENAPAGQPSPSPAPVYVASHIQTQTLSEEI